MSTGFHKRASAHGIDLYMHSVGSRVYVVYKRTKDGFDGLKIYDGGGAPIRTPRREFYKAFAKFVEPWMGEALDLLPTSRDVETAPDVKQKAIAARQALVEFTSKHRVRA